MLIPPVLSAAPCDGAVLACIEFSAAPGAWRVPLLRLSGAPAEVWGARGPVRAGCFGAAHWRCDGEHAFLALHVGDGELEAAAEEAYRLLFAALDRLGIPHLLRTWNYFSRISEGEGEAERYRAFVRGRARAFAGRLEPGRYPAATVIGSAVPGLVVHALAASRPGEALENPRQVPAWRYPPRYGRVPPSFARAMRTDGGLLLISGTASVVGHESRHPGDLAGQFAEAWRNLEKLCELAAERQGAGQLQTLRVYLREAAQLPELLPSLPAGIPYVVLQGEICRPELLLELEAVWAPLSNGARSRPAVSG